jgi:hypothetical protein
MPSTLPWNRCREVGASPCGVLMRYMAMGGGGASLLRCDNFVEIYTSLECCLNAGISTFTIYRPENLIQKVLFSMNQTCVEICVRYQVLSAATMKTAIIWDVTSCSLVGKPLQEYTVPQPRL